jgi:hypothetical protein
MRIICEDNVISVADKSVLLRSAVLSDMHRRCASGVEPERCVRMPCDTQTWRAWVTDDPSRMTADRMELFVSVIKVRPLYAWDFCMLAGASTCSLPWVSGNTLLFETNEKHHSIILHRGDSVKSIEDYKQG